MKTRRDFHSKYFYIQKIESTLIAITEYRVAFFNLKTSETFFFVILEIRSDQFIS